MANIYLSKLRITLWGRLFYKMFPIRKQIVLDNIDRVFKDGASPEEKERLARAFYSHVCSMLKELALLGWLSTKRIKRQVELRGVEHLLAAERQGRGVLILTGHLGCWEFGPVGLQSITQLADKMYVIRRPIRNKWLENKIFQRFDRWGIKRINSIDGIKKINAALKKQGIVVYLFDQHAETHSGMGIAVDFFGIQAGTYRSLAFFAQKYQTPVIPASIYREKGNKHVLEFHPPIGWENNADKEVAIYNNTLKYNQALEKIILEHPGQWWWVHRRWKL
ncbi:lysophospholipid acyltransferase family protein [Legionella fallonii]|uniref:Lipid A biosynthesis lauroyl acyltransferase n=1 Tax=Legionella fallonii LLAP-10 TaxID=1212491 RepID=A0A098GAJ0_9GAMM|nr:lysophospholipid acyltransferase family protein [Legionella fallonii]CEG59040.1 Lipid A biosynthesis lauroyl acyltransferase [Legionella fallonii LLAP-10]